MEAGNLFRYQTGDRQGSAVANPGSEIINRQCGGGDPGLRDPVTAAKEHQYYRKQNE